MAGRYTVETLLLLSQSPLCVKPPSLPPPEEWMGPPPETTRNPTKPVNDRSKGSDSILLDNRRSGTDRNAPRNNSHPDDIILGPPRTSFTSSSIGAKPGDGDKGSKDSELRDRSDRFNFRNRSSETDAIHDRFRDARTNNYGRDQDGDTRSAVKPRKSFGNEGAERFQGRIGGVDRFPNRDDRRTRDRDDRENGERRTRNFDRHSQDKEGEDADGTRRNGLGRGRSDPWFKEGSDAAPPPSQRERIDRTKNWRERDPNDRPSERQSERQSDRPNNRGFDRRWDREQRVEREPEWLDEPAEENPKGHTEEDFKKFMEAMKAGRGGASKSEDKSANPIDRPNPDPAILAEQKKVVSAPPVESGPDKFFAAYGSATLDTSAPVADTKEVTVPKAAKPSRFTSFFSGHEDTRGKTEPPTPAAGPPPLNGMNQPPQPDAEREAFQVLLQKLQRQTLAGTNQPGSPPQLPLSFSENSIPPGAQHHKSDGGISLESFQPYGVDRRADPRLDPRLRPQSHPVQDILSPRPMAPPAQPPAPRPEQSLQDLLMQRHHVPPPNQGGGRMEPNSAAANDNSEFLMRLMQSARNAPEPPRTEQLLSRMPQPAKHANNVPTMSDRDAEYQRERSASQRQIRLPGPPGFLDEQFHNPDGDNRPQPTQILQRPPPPGLDHHMHPFAMAGGGQMPPQRPMIPPPGIINNPRNMPMPPSMFPPNFPPGAFPPLDGMGGPPAPGPGPGPGPRPVQPPPGFYGGPPPGFIPHHGMGNFQGPEGLAFGAPFDGRGMPPPGAAFRRQ